MLNYCRLDHEKKVRCVTDWIMWQGCTLCFIQMKSKLRRVKAMYDCVADHHDELTFSEGEVLVVLGEEDTDWWVSSKHKLHEAKFS